MMLRSALFKAAGLLLVALLQGVMAGAESLEFKADAESVRLGVARYVLDRAGRTLNIQVLDAKGAEMAAITARLGTPEGILMEIRSATEDLHMTWSIDTGQFSVLDNKTGDTAMATPKPGQPKALVLEGSKPSLVGEHQHLIALAVVAVEQNMLNLGMHPTTPSYSRPAKLSASSCPTGRLQEAGSHLRTATAKPADDPDCSPGCDGPIVEGGVRGASSRSLGCNSASQATADECSNQWCFGCCRTLGCDCACLAATDYLCVCTVEGQACSPPTGDDCDGNGSGGGGGGGGGGGCERGPSGVCGADCFSCTNAVGSPSIGG